MHGPGLLLKQQYIYHLPLPQCGAALTWTPLWVHKTCLGVSCICKWNGQVWKMMILLHYSCPHPASSFFFLNQKSVWGVKKECEIWGHSVMEYTLYHTQNLHVLFYKEGTIFSWSEFWSKTKVETVFEAWLGKDTVSPVTCRQKPSFHQATDGHQNIALLLVHYVFKQTCHKTNKVTCSLESVYPRMNTSHHSFLNSKSIHLQAPVLAAGNTKLPFEAVSVPSCLVNW